MSLLTQEFVCTWYITIDIELVRQKLGTILENKLSQMDYACFLISYVQNLFMIIKIQILLVLHTFQST